MGMVKMEHVNIYGDGREPRAALELLAGLSCFDPDDAKAFVAQQSAQEEENMFEPLLAQALGLLKDLGKAPPDAPVAPPRAFTFGEVQATVEKFAAEVAERGQRMAELNARIASCEQTKEQLYHLCLLYTSLRAGRGGAAHADDSQQGRISPRRPEFHMRTGGGG